MESYISIVVNKPGETVMPTVKIFRGYMVNELSFQRIRCYKFHVMS